ncbi:hypothetical protein KIK06_26420 [Nocardiopsis sp. EMB25]|uniref:hypothetical protein n=1 Tax=Nocardiopsis TaxID=2013 RepID=UPI000347743A|nr:MULTISPECIES: hypothetical protein [Nocardiopsis]MCY9787421.1 hypothetical protein [Nocardiopsis sp. EMB25]
MTQVKRTSARTLVLAAGTAGFVALGAGIAGADALESPTHEIAPIVERALVEGVAPTMRGLAPEGAVPIADSALQELQRTAKDPNKPAPDLSAPLPESGRLVTPVADVASPLPAVGEAVAETQDATGLDGDPHHTIGHSAGDTVTESATGAGDSLEDLGGLVEDTASDAGGRVEGSAGQVLPHTVQAAHGLKDELDVPAPSELTRLAHPSELSGLTEGAQLPLAEGSGLPEATNLTDLTGDNSLALSDVADLPLAGDTGTVHQSSAAPAVPNIWDMAYVFGLETPKQAQDLVESNPVTDDNYVNLGEGEVLGLVGQRNMEEPLTMTVAQSAPAGSGLDDLTGSLPEVTEGGLPRVAEGVDTRTAEDLVDALSQGPSVLEDLDTSDLVSIEGGGPAQAPAQDDGLTHHPTFTELPGHEALPVVA